MKYFVLLLSALLLIQPCIYSQEGGIINQTYNKDETQYMCKEYLVNEILIVPENKLIGIEIEAITASKSGELTTVVYNCPELDKKGIFFSFWQNTFNEYNTRYKGYAFRNIEYDDALELFDKLLSSIDNKKTILSRGSDWNAVLHWEDMFFVFYSEGASNKIRVFWNGFDSEWNQSNLKTTSRRFKKSFK